jgi:hypothetical protein
MCARGRRGDGRVRASDRRSRRTDRTPRNSWASSSRPTNARMEPGSWLVGRSTTTPAWLPGGRVRRTLIQHGVHVVALSRALVGEDVREVLVELEPHAGSVSRRSGRRRYCGIGRSQLTYRALPQWLRVGAGSMEARIAPTCGRRPGVEGGLIRLQLSGQDRQSRRLRGRMKPSVPGRHDHGGDRDREGAGEVDGVEAGQGM